MAAKTQEEWTELLVQAKRRQGKYIGGGVLCFVLAVGFMVCGFTGSLPRWEAVAGVLIMAVPTIVCAIIIERLERQASWFEMERDQAWSQATTAANLRQGREIGRASLRELREAKKTSDDLKQSQQNKRALREQGGG